MPCPRRGQGTSYPLSSARFEHDVFDGCEHPLNPSQAAVMVRRLESAGFDVIRIPVSELTEKKLFEWVEDARELWEELQE